MIYFFYGDNQKNLKDHLFDLKKRAPLVEEFDARFLSWEEFISRVKTSTFLFAPQKKEHARLIAVSDFTKSTLAFQKSFFGHAAALARLPDVIVLFEEQEIKDKKFFESVPPCVKIKHFILQEKPPSRDPLTPFLFGCANAWTRGDRATALRAAHNFFEHGGSSEQLFFMLAAYVKKTKEPYAALRILRDQFIASRLEKADLRLIIFAFLSAQHSMSDRSRSFNVGRGNETG